MPERRARPLDIGIVGGMSPESTLTYYQHIVRRHAAEFGDHSYPRIVIASVSFQRYIEWQHQGDWRSIAAELEAEFHALAAAGAEFGVLASNTMHKVLPDIESPIPILSILDAVGTRLRRAGVGTVALTGTRFTMSEGFYARGLEERGLRVVLPEPAVQEQIHRIIYDELTFGRVREPSVAAFRRICATLVERGAGAIVLGCTELQLLAEDDWLRERAFDSALIHAEAAWCRAVGRSSDAAA